MTNTNFVIFRYPGERSYIIVENEGDEAFIFMDFHKKHPVTIKGEKKAFSSTSVHDILVDEKKQFQHYISTKQDYFAQFDQYQKAFDESHIDKTILSRIIEVPSTDIDIEKIFSRLEKKYQTALVYVAQLSDYGLWVGATPERLVKKDDQGVHTVALAGTKTSNDPDKWTRKEYEEHREVEKHIEALSLNSDFKLINRTQPHIVEAGTIYHLKSDFTFLVDDDKLDQFINELHPTPAVCGMPTEKSLHLIKDTEKHDRLFYTGYLGLVPQNAKSEFEYYVNLRCMQIVAGRTFLYVGGGITKKSLAEDEWNETINKAETIKSIL